MSWVYVIKAVESNGSTTYYKIGQTRMLDVMRRAGWILVECPLSTELVHTIQCPPGKARGCEMILHGYFAHKRVRGEWFDLDDDDVLFVKSITRMEFRSDAHFRRERVRATESSCPARSLDPSPFVYRGSK